MPEDSKIALFNDIRKQRLIKEFRNELEQFLPILQEDVKTLRELMMKYGNMVPKDCCDNTEAALIRLADGVIKIKKDLIKGMEDK